MPVLELAAVLAALAAILFAWRVRQEIKQITAKVDRLQTTLYETRQDQRLQQEQTELKLATLDVALQKTKGTLRFDPNVSLTELFEIEPRAQAVLAAFHIGGCASCAVDENRTLADAARERGADLDTVLTALNTLPAQGVHADLRMPNVRFEIE
jgi:hypothetical protein